MARAAASLLIAGLGSVTAFTVIGAADADEPIPYGAQATVYRTLTETRTVNRRVEGHTVGWWRKRAQANRKEANAHRIRLRMQQRIMQRRFTSSLHGLVDAFLCVHSYEGGWDADTGNGYHGGLQMDRTFMGQYGAWAIRRWGDAENWPPSVQIVVALTAYYSGRGFAPWPMTSQMCGLR